MMGAPIGNKYWELRGSHGRNTKFKNAEELWDAACEYFQWCDQNPIIENKVVNSSKEGIVDHPVNHPRPYTAKALCIFIGCNTEYLNELKNTQEDFSQTVTHIQDIIFTQKFDYAVADMMNPSLIGKHLGIKEPVQHSNDPDNPMPGTRIERVVMNYQKSDGT